MDKRKRDFSYGIRAWWLLLDDVDRFVIKLISGIMLTFILFLFLAREAVRYESTRPCEYYANTSMEDLPARCLEYYGVKADR